MQFTLKKLKFISLLLGLVITHTVFAEDKIAEFWDDTKITGDIRSYYFTRDYSKPGKLNQAAYAIGGDLGILTGQFLGGFRIGATVYTAQSLGLNGNDYQRIDMSLPGNAITALGQAYLQYSHDHFLIRGGDQLINTPWLNAADTRMIPATYRGLLATWQLNQNWTITALRTFAFKSRVANDFYRTNAYYPENQGAISTTKLDQTAVDGAQALGIAYTNDALNAQIWGYQFFDFAKLVYGDVQYTFKNKSNIYPLVGAQLFMETGDGNNILSQVATGKANSKGYGVLIGAEAPYAKLTLGYNRIISHTGAFNNGDVVSPYTFTSDPLYTKSMIAGLVDKSAGDAWKITGTFFAFEKQLQFIASYAKYFTQPYLPNTDETNLDILYAFKKSKYKSLRGLSLRNRLGIMTGDPTRGTFCYNRIMLQYSF